MKRKFNQIFLIIFVIFSLLSQLSSMEELQIATTRQLQQNLIELYKQQGLRPQQAQRYVKKISILLKKLANIFAEYKKMPQISDSDEFFVYDYEIQKICIKTIFLDILPSLGNPLSNSCLRQMAEEFFTLKYQAEFSEQVEPPSLKRIKKFILKTLILFIKINQEIFRFPEAQSAQDLESLEASVHEESSPEEDEQIVYEHNPEQQSFILSAPPRKVTRS
jgi:hypothetical protein